MNAKNINKTRNSQNILYTQDIHIKQIWEKMLFTLDIDSLCSCWRGALAPLWSYYDGMYIICNRKSSNSASICRICAVTYASQ